MSRGIDSNKKHKNNWSLSLRSPGWFFHNIKIRLEINWRKNIVWPAIEHMYEILHISIPCQSEQIILDAFSLMLKFTSVIFFGNVHILYIVVMFTIGYSNNFLLKKVKSQNRYAYVEQGSVLEILHKIPVGAKGGKTLVIVSTLFYSFFFFSFGSLFLTQGKRWPCCSLYHAQSLCYAFAKMKVIFCLLLTTLSSKLG